MKTIVKGPEPRSLTIHRQTRPCDYENYMDKDTLRNALVVEQQGLCCYCMGRICPNARAMKIEHWQCQARYPRQRLKYRNLLGACLGGEGQSSEFQHCDTRKGDRDLRWNPADPNRRIEAWIGYDDDGTIWSCDQEFNDQLHTVLNLNLAILKNRRKDVVDSLLFWWREQRRRRPVSRRQIERKLSKFTDGNGELTEYCQVAVWWLQKKINKLQR